MRSEFKSATQIYVNPIHFEIQLILGIWHIFTYPVLINKIDETENGRPPTCSVCNTAVTVEHILISCTKYKTKREVVFTDHYTNGSEPSMKSILQE